MRLPDRRRPAASAAGMSSRSAKRCGADHAGLCEQCVIGTVRACQRAGVGDYRTAARLRAADLERDNRLSGARRLQGRGTEFGGIANRLDIQRDHLCAGIVRQPVQEIGQIQVGLVAGGDQLGMTDARAAA